MLARAPAKAYQQDTPNPDNHRIGRQRMCIEDCPECGDYHGQKDQDKPGPAIAFWAGLRRMLLEIPQKHQG